MGKGERASHFSSEEKHEPYLAPMASANVELVRSINADWERGDFTAARWADPEIEFVRVDGHTPDAIASFGALGNHKGRAAIRRFFEDFTGSFVDFENEFEETRDFGDGVVFVVFVQRGRPVGSNDWVEFRAGAVLTLANGRIERQTNNVDVDQACAAAERLSEERE